MFSLAWSVLSFDCRLHITTDSVELPRASFTGDEASLTSDGASLTSDSDGASLTSDGASFTGYRS